MSNYVQQAQQQAYQQKVDKVKPKPPLLKNLVWAFAVGGLICVLGQFVQNSFIEMGFSKKDAAAPTAVVMELWGGLFTGRGIYDELGKHAGAGSVVPITGFANSIVSPAMEFKREGYVFGVGAKMFVVAGPVLVYGMVAAFFIGLIYWLIH